MNEKIQLTSTTNPFSLRRRGIPSLLGEGHGEVILAFQTRLNHGNHKNHKGSQFRQLLKSPHSSNMVAKPFIC